jgi:hypothetical protein
VGIVFVIIVVVMAIGAILPEAHVARRTVLVHRAPDVVWGIVTDFASFPSWRPGLKGVEILPPHDGRTVFREEADHRKITFEVEEQTAPSRLVTRIADESLPFGGRWIFEIIPEGDQTRVTITEEGKVKTALFRFMSRFVFGYYTTLDRYLTALGSKLGEKVEPQTP